jgi:steroid delta-isomerase-like uncharacterized protein
LSNPDHKSATLALLDCVWSRGDIEASDLLVAPRYTVFHDPGDPWDGQVLDRSGFEERVRQSRKPFPDQRFEVQHVVGEDQNVAVAWTWRATHLGDIPGFPASGRTITMSGLTLYSFQDSLITGHWQCADRLGVYGQLQQAKRSS